MKTITALLCLPVFRRAVAMEQDARAAAAIVERIFEQMVDALGTAGSLSSGIIEYLAEGAWTKRLHAGWAARIGIHACRIAQHGFLGPRTVFEGTHGFFYTFARNANGDFDIVTGNSANIPNIRKNGGDVISFAALLPQYGGDIVATKAWAAKMNITGKSPYKDKLQIFKGATIGVTGAGGGSDQITRFLAREGGLNPDRDMTIVASPDPAAMQAAVGPTGRPGLQDVEDAEQDKTQSEIAERRRGGGVGAGRADQDRRGRSPSGRSRTCAQEQPESHCRASPAPQTRSRCCPCCA